VLVYRPFRRREYPYGGYGVIDVNVTAATFHASQEIAGGQVDAVVSLGKTRTRRYAEPGFGEFRARLKDVSGEIFGKWKPTDSITLRAGVHALDSRFRQHIDVSRNFVGSIGNFRDHQNSFGLFGEVEAAFTDRLSASVGGRYQQDRQQRTGELVGRTNASIDFDERFSAFLPRAVASYAITPRLKAGVLIQKAYNPGGATFNVFTGELDTFKAETLWNYEAFLKGNLAGGRVTIEANIFYNDITDSQRSVITPITRPDGQPAFVVQFNNVPRASVRGAEVELSWRASPKLALSGGVGLQRTKIRSSQNSDGDIIGREFQRAPHFTGNVAADWTPTDRLRLSAQLRYHSDYFSDDFDTPELRIPDAAIVDARAAYALKKFTLFAYAQNLFDHFSLNYRFSSDVASADDPRVVGAGIEARF
jgi:outer membrane receptor protein involved in Fe transport